MKKVLFVTYYWPPAGGPAINRIFNFYKFLPEFGWEPIILTVSAGNFPFFDPSFLKHVRPETKIYRTKNFVLPGLAGNSKVSVSYGFTDPSKKSFKSRILRFIKYNMIPDTRIIWSPFAIKKAIEIVEKEKIELIFSSSPPPTNHIIASIVADKTKKPWVGDLRDPWTDVFWLKSQKIRLGPIHALDKIIEAKTLGRMTEIIAISPSFKNLLQEKTKREVNLIYNGFDPSMFSTEVEKTDGQFNILYAGSLSYEQRPLAFFDALICIKEKHPLVFHRISIEFLGAFPEFLDHLIEEKGLSEKIKKTNYLPMEEAISRMKSSDLLLLIIPESNDELILTSKLFDYLGSKRPILAYGQRKSDIGKILEETGAGKLFSHSDIENSYQFILDVYNNNFQLEDENIRKISKYNRRDQAKCLADIFEKAINRFENEK